MTDTDELRGSDGRGRKDRAQGNVFSRLALFILRRTETETMAAWTAAVISDGGPS